MEFVHAQADHGTHGSYLRHVGQVAAAALAALDTPVVAVVGDAGMDMAPGDFVTLRDMGGPLVTIVLVNEALTLIDRKQRAKMVAA